MKQSDPFKELHEFEARVLKMMEDLNITWNQAWVACGGDPPIECRSILISSCSEVEAALSEQSRGVELGLDTPHHRDR